jgi:hypothetical protein
MDRNLAAPTGPAGRALRRWEQRGAISLWRYAENSRHFEGWHFAADEEGCRSLLALIDLLMDANDPSLYRTLRILRATDAILRVPNNRGAPAVSPVGWRLRLSPAHDDWRLAEDGDRLELALGETRMREMRASVEATLRGDGDFSIGPGRDDTSSRHALWFWWWPRSRV